MRPLASLAALSAGLLLAAAFVGISAQGNVVAREAERLREEIAAEQQRRADHEAELVRRSGDDYVIEQARDLGYVRPGEGLIAVERPSEPQVAGALDVSLDGGRIARWIAFFFGQR